MSRTLERYLLEVYLTTLEKVSLHMAYTLGVLLNYFEQFGPVEDCIIMIDRDNSKLYELTYHLKSQEVSVLCSLSKPRA